MNNNILRYDRSRCRTASVGVDVGDGNVVVVSCIVDGNNNVIIIIVVCAARTRGSQQAQRRGGVPEEFDQETQGRVPKPTDRLVAQQNVSHSQCDEHQLGGPVQVIHSEKSEEKDKKKLKLKTN